MVGILSCDRDAAGPVSSDGDRLSTLLANAREASLRTPMPDWEAEELAMTLSRELTAPRNLYDRIKRDLAEIRSEYGEDVPAVNIQFRPTFISGAIYIKYYPGIVDDSSSEAFSFFNSLNSAFGLKNLRQASPQSYELELDGRYNPVRLVDQYYSHIPDGIEALYSTYRLMLDNPGLHVAIEGRTIKYFFRDAWGDCPSGCIFSHVHYFVSRGERITYVDDYLSDDYPPPPLPEWFDEFIAAFKNSMYGIRWYPDSAVYWP
jgi:hypothetical protein